MKYFAFGVLLVFCVCGCSEGTGTTSRGWERMDRDPFGGRDYLQETLDEVDRLTGKSVPAGHARIKILHVETEAASAYRLMTRDVRFRVPSGALGGLNGVMIFGTDRDAIGRLRMGNASRQKFTEQFLVLAEGGEGLFQVLRTSPQVWSVSVPIYNGRMLVHVIEERVLGTSMGVRLHRIGADSVDVELTPWFNCAPRGRAVRVTELRTRLSLAPNRPYVIMSQNSGGRDFASSFFSRAGSSSSRRTLAVITVETSPLEK